MIKTIFLLLSLLLISPYIYAQLFPYNPREWDTNWTYTKFSDLFRGTLLDTTKWEVVKDYGRGKCVFVDSVGTTYSVNNGLSLNMIYHPGYCYQENGAIYCQDYISSEIWSKEKFKYGIYEGRMKFATDEGSWPAFWFYGGSGADDPKYNTGYASEIDIAEYNWRKKEWPSGGYYVHTDHVFHWWWPQSIYGTQEMNIYDGIKNNYIAWNTSHTFKLIYTPYEITFYIDGILNWRRSRFYTRVDNLPVDIFIENMNGSTQYPENEWYPKHEGHIILSQQVSGNVWNGDISAPQSSLFEWVTYKKFFLSPEITVPSYICSTGTATLDVDPLATNISWQITPSNLVASPSGTGLTANITLLPAASGIGTIIYSFSMPSGEIFTARKEFQVGLKASFSGNTTVLVGGSGKWTATATCGVSPFNYEWFLREDDGSGAGPILISTGNPLILWSVPRLASAAGFEQPDSLNRQPLTKTIYYLSVRANDTNGRVFVTPEKQVIAYGDVDLIDPRARIQQDVEDENVSALRLVTSPNPASGETSLELVGTNGQVLDASIEWQLEIYDAIQSLKVKALKVKGSKQIIRTMGWKEGLYIIKIKVNNKMLCNKLFIRH